MQGFAWIKLGQRFQGATEDSRAHQWLWDIAPEEIDVFNMSMQGLWPLGQSTFKTFWNEAKGKGGSTWRECQLSGFRFGIFIGCGCPSLSWVDDSQRGQATSLKSEGQGLICHSGWGICRTVFFMFPKPQVKKLRCPQVGAWVFKQGFAWKKFGEPSQVAIEDPVRRNRRFQIWLGELPGRFLFSLVSPRATPAHSPRCPPARFAGSEMTNARGKGK